MNYASLSEIGNRKLNEDCAAVKEADNAALFMVCDGLGGHNKGEVASGIAVQTLSTAFESSFCRSTSFFPDTLMAVKDALCTATQGEASFSDMRTTVTALRIEADRCCWCHVGDSRIYGFKNGNVTMITRDHSVPRMLAESGEIRFSDIRRHPDRNKLLRAMGVDFVKESAEYSKEHNLSEFDAFLLCSDGFWELINERKMCRTLRHSKTAAEWLGAMTEAVRRKGRRTQMDNYTAVAVMLTGKENE